MEIEKQHERSKRQERWWWARNIGLGLLFVCAVSAATLYVAYFGPLEKIAASFSKAETGTAPAVQVPSPPVPLSLVQTRVDVWQKMLGVTALLIGGGWAVVRFGWTRMNEAALKIETSTLTFVPQLSQCVVFFEVKLENTGKVKLGAQSKKYKAPKGIPRQLKVAYVDDGSEILDFSVSLLVRPLPEPGYLQSETGKLGKRDKQLDWFTGMDANFKPKGLVAEIDLIDSYELHNGKVNFWMEPGEIYHLPVTLELDPGDYMGMITFIGARGQFEFWRRFMLLQVPDPTKATKPDPHRPEEKQLSHNAKS